MGKLLFILAFVGMLLIAGCAKSEKAAVTAPTTTTTDVATDLGNDLDQLDATQDDLDVSESDVDLGIQ